MKLKSTLCFLSFLLIFCCSKNTNEYDDGIEDPEFSLEVIYFDQTSVNFTYSIDTTLENLKLIWNTSDNLDLNNKLGEINIDQSVNEITISNLIQGETYYFRFVTESDDEVFYSEIVEVTLEPEFSIEIMGFDHNSVNFSYSVNSNIENIKLLWNTTETVDLDNKIGELSVTLELSEVAVPNLESGQTYYFRFVGEFNNEIIYSDIVESTLLEQFTISEYSQILNSVTYGKLTHEILTLNDGYLFVTGGNPYSVSKTDNNFNLIWTFDITDPNEDLFYNGIFPLNSNNDYLIFFVGISAFNTDPWGGGYSPDYEVHYVKFNLSGNMSWHRTNSTNIQDNSFVDHYDIPINFSKNSVGNQILIKSDSTYNIDNDEYYRQLKFDNEGEIIENEIIEGNLGLLNVLFQQNGEYINYGTKDLYPTDGTSARDIILQKFSNNEIIQDFSYGSSGGNEQLSNILHQGSNIVILGTNGHENETDGESAWIFSIDPLSGEIIWQINEFEEEFSYNGKDLILDNDGNYLSLIHELYNVHYTNGNCCVTTYDYDFASIIKSDSEGNIIWKFVDGEPNNDDNFEPQKIVKNGEDYVIVGNLNGNLWIKRISVE